RAGVAPFADPGIGELIERHHAAPDLAAQVLPVPLAVRERVAPVDTHHGTIRPRARRLRQARRVRLERVVPGATRGLLRPSGVGREIASVLLEGDLRRVDVEREAAPRRRIALQVRPVAENLLLEAGESLVARPAYQICTTSGTQGPPHSTG